MAKYVDVKKLYEYLEQVGELYPGYADNIVDNAVNNVIGGIKTFIASLQQERPKVDLVAELKHHLDATPKEQLEKEWKELEPWGNIGPTVQEFLFGRQPEVDLEKVWDWIDENFTETEIDDRYGETRNVVMSSFDVCKSDLREKYERDFGLNTRK